jgi:hypothetical membrane protein
MKRSVMVGAAAWILTLLMFAAEAITMWAWPRRYSFSGNTISDLGSTSCGTLLGAARDGVYVCSPQHAVMNTAFVAVGVLTAIGAFLLRPHWPPSPLTTWGLGTIAASGAGSVLIGLATSDQNLPVHVFGALLQVPGAIGPLLLALAMRPGAERAFSSAMGILGGVASVLFLAGVHLGIGPGGMERLAFEPLTFWTGVTGALMFIGRAPAIAGKPRSGAERVPERAALGRPD